MSSNIVGKFTCADVLPDIIEIALPAGAVPLHFNLQKGVLCLWAFIDADEQKYETRRFRMAGTGHDIAQPYASLRYINTIMLDGGSLVFHYFEILG